MTRLSETLPNTLTPLVSGILEDSRTLFRQEVALARSEIREEMKVAKKAAGKFAVGSMLAYLALILGAFTLVQALAWAVPTNPLWTDYATVTVLFAMVAGAQLHSAFGWMENSRIFHTNAGSTTQEINHHE